MGMKRRFKMHIWLDECGCLFIDHIPTEEFVINMENALNLMLLKGLERRGCATFFEDVKHCLGDPLDEGLQIPIPQNPALGKFFGFFFFFQLELSGKREPQLRNCFHRIGLWANLYRRAQSTGGGLSLGKWCLRRQTGWVTGRKTVCSVLLWSLFQFLLCLSSFLDFSQWCVVVMT